MRYDVHLRQKANGKVTVVADSPQDATNKAKRMIHMNSLPEGAMEDSVIFVTFTEQV